MVPNRRHSFVTAVVLVLLLPPVLGNKGCAADGEVCPNEAPDEWTPLDAEVGEECLYDVDCYSGICMPFGDVGMCNAGAAFTATCTNAHGAGYVAGLANRCDGTVETICRHNTATPPTCGATGSCTVGSLCVKNDDCGSGWCAVDIGEDTGVCVQPAYDSCPSGTVVRRISNYGGSDHHYVCVPGHW